MLSALPSDKYGLCLGTQVSMFPTKIGSGAHATPIRSCRLPMKKTLNNRKDVQKSRSGMEDNPQVRKCSLFVPRMQNLPIVSPETLLLFTKKKNVDENALKHLIWKILLDTPTVLLQLSSKKRKLVELRENGSSYFQTVCFPACLHELSVLR